ncbi:MAG TPA: hypothetical protein VHC47_15100 [Mucilaginibacter sp.]|nr:hypothetical protein [Mucilaginibacter sp.]
MNQLGYLYDYKFLELVVHHKFDEIERLYKNQDTSLRLSMDSFYPAFCELGGILICFIISLVLSIKNKWLWLNSLIVLIAEFGSFCIDRFYWSSVKSFFMFPGIPFKSDWGFNFTGGMFMIAIGMTLFFWKRIIRFIDGTKAHPVEPV